MKPDAMGELKAAFDAPVRPRQPVRPTPETPKPTLRQAPRAVQIDPQAEHLQTSAQAPLRAPLEAPLDTPSGVAQPTARSEGFQISEHTLTAGLTFGTDTRSRSDGPPTKLIIFAVLLTLTSFGVAYLLDGNGAAMIMEDF